VINKIDIGNFATRTKFSKQIRFNKGNYGADGDFVEEYISKFCKESDSIKKINQALYVHN
jgi:hypothetical protein